MSNKQAYTDVIRQVGLAGDPVLTVRPSPDSPTDWVQLCAADSLAREFWGNVDVSMTADMARNLAAALLNCADEVGGVK